LTSSQFLHTFAVQMKRNNINNSNLYSKDFEEVVALDEKIIWSGKPTYFPYIFKDYLQLILGLMIYLICYFINQYSDKTGIENLGGVKLFAYFYYAVLDLDLSKGFLM
jgi:hypothetical protein